MRRGFEMERREKGKKEKKGDWEGAVRKEKGRKKERKENGRDW